MKNKYLIMLFIIVITGVAFFYVSVTSVRDKVETIVKYDDAIKKQQEKLNSAKVLNEQLKEVSKVIMNSMTDSRRYTPEEVNSFVKLMADLADKYKIAVNSISPKVVANVMTNYIEQQYIMELDCTFIKLGQFLTELERIDSIIKANTLEIRPIGKTGAADETSETRYKISLDISTYKILKEA